MNFHEQVLETWKPPFLESWFSFADGCFCATTAICRHIHMFLHTYKHTDGMNRNLRLIGMRAEAHTGDRSLQTHTVTVHTASNGLMTLCMMSVFIMIMLCIYRTVIVFLRVLVHLQHVMYSLLLLLCCSFFWMCFPNFHICIDLNLFKFESIWSQSNAAERRFTWH